MKYKLLALILIIVVAFGLGYTYFNVASNHIHPLSNNWELAIPNQKIPKGLTSLSAESCGVCHVDHYNEWKTSTHAHAWTDLQFQAELKKESSPFMCINCHIPLQNQQAFIIKGLIDGDIYQPVKIVNPHFDRKLQEEGINCAGCHVRNNMIIGLAGSKLAPHPIVVDSVFLSEKLCISCHNANAVITPTLACTFQTGDEWKEGPYYRKKNCIGCHMESIERETVKGFGIKKGHRHFFPGSGIPKLNTLTANLLNGLEFYPSILHKSYKVNDTIEFTLKLINENAGHRVPTGDPERFFLIKMHLIEENGDTLMTKVDRIGEIWEWHPIAIKLSDNNIDPLGERNYNLSYPVKNKGKLMLFIIVTKHRISEEALKYNNLGEDYPSFIQVYERAYKIMIK